MRTLILARTLCLIITACGFAATASANQAPNVEAGPNMTIDYGERALLTGSVSDDGLPNPPGAVSLTWRLLIGPSPVLFADSTAAHTEVAFDLDGVYVMTLNADDGALTNSDFVFVTVNAPCQDPPVRGPTVSHVLAPIIADTTITASADDAEESPAGSVSLAGSGLEMVDDGGLQTVGLRFNGIDLPRGGTVAQAFLEFSAEQTDAGAAFLTIEAEDADSADAFTAANGNLSTRPRTSAAVIWTPGPWTIGARGLNQRTPNLAPIIQELLDRPNWAGRSLVLLITGSGRRTATSFDGDPLAAPRLFIEVCTPPNQPPTVDAGPDQTVPMAQGAILAGDVQDDGLPHPPDLTTTDWNQVSGPGAVSFGDETAVSTSASFSAIGDYVLELSAYDGEFTVSDSIEITVTDGAVSVGPGNALPGFGLTSIAPHPMTRHATIEYALPFETGVDLSIVDLQGRVVAHLVRDRQGPGRHSVQWDGVGVRGTAAPGLYFVRLSAAGHTSTRRLMRLQ